MKMYLKNIAKIVREGRVALGLSQRELAYRAHLSDRYVSMMETEMLADFRFSKLDDLAKALGCKVVDLLGSGPKQYKQRADLPRLKKKVVPNEAAAGLDVAIKLLNQVLRQAKS